MRELYIHFFRLESVSMVACSEQTQPSSLDTLDSEDTVIISDRPSRKRQRLDTEAKQVSADIES